MNAVTMVIVGALGVVACSFADEIVLPNGDVLKDVRVTKVEPDGLRVIHSVGMAKVNFEDLPPALQTKYGFDPAKAAVYRDATDAVRRQVADSRRARIEEAQKAEREAAARAANTPRLTTSLSVKASWARSLAMPIKMDYYYNRKMRFNGYVSTLLQSGELDLEAEQTALQWNINEYTRVGQVERAQVLNADLQKVREAIQSRNERRQQAQIAAMNAELQAAQIESLSKLGDALNEVAFSLNNGVDVYLWDMR